MPYHEQHYDWDDTTHYDDHDTFTSFRGLSHQSHTPEEIDPEFHTLHKRKKQRRKAR